MRAIELPAVLLAAFGQRLTCLDSLRELLLLVSQPNGPYVLRMSILPFADSSIFPALAAVFEQMLDDDREAGDAFARAKAALVEAEALCLKNERDIDEAVNRLRVIVEKGRDPGEDLDEYLDFDRVIESNLVAEQTLAAEAAASLRLASKLGKFLKRHNSKHHLVMAPLLDEVEVVTRRSLEHLRDVRWTLMALKSKVERGNEGPVLESPRALSAYLNSLT